MNNRGRLKDDTKGAGGETPGTGTSGTTSAGQCYSNTPPLQKRPSVINVKPEEP